jgi:hypothetical protein
MATPAVTGAAGLSPELLLLLVVGLLLLGVVMVLPTGPASTLSTGVTSMLEMASAFTWGAWRPSQAQKLSTCCCCCCHGNSTLRRLT